MAVWSKFKYTIEVFRTYKMQYQKYYCINIKIVSIVNFICSNSIIYFLQCINYIFVLNIIIWHVLTLPKLVKERLINFPAVICVGWRDMLIINMRSRAAFPGKLYHSILYDVCPTLLHYMSNFIYLWKLHMDCVYVYIHMFK